MKKVWLIVIILCFGAAAVFAGLAISGSLKEKNSGKSYEQLREDVKQLPEGTQSQETTPPPGETAEGSQDQPAAAEAKKEPVVIPIDFKALQEINPDAYAWITIPGTEVDYPVVQHPTDDTYYMHRNIYGEYDYAGTLFTEATYNTKTFEDANTVIYGHRMKNGTMFKGLSSYEDRAFFKDNNEILIYTPDRILHYRIFAAYLYDTRHIMLTYNCEDPETFAQYIREIYESRDMMKNLDSDTVIKPGDKILTLSTCYAEDGSNRWIVQGVLTQIEE